MKCDGAHSLVVKHYPVEVATRVQFPLGTPLDFFISSELCYYLIMVEGNPKPKILLIEDDAFMVDLLGKELGVFGYQIEIAKTGLEGVNKFHILKPDLVLLDILLPDQNGFDVLRQIRRDPEGHETKVLVLSNLDKKSDLEEAKRLNVTDYLVKANFSLSEIVARIRGVLEK